MATTDIHAGGTMRTAWNLVCPRRRAERLVEAGLVTAQDISRVTWRDAIAATLTDVELNEAGVTIEDVRTAVAFYTGCKAQITREKIAGVWGKKYEPPVPGYLVIAEGYRMGPWGP